MLFAVAVVVEFFLAGLSVFDAMPGDDESVAHEKFEDTFSAHADVGWYLFLGSVLLFIVVLFAWTGPRSIAATLALAVLAFLQMILGRAGEDAPVAGALHVITGLLILGLSWFLAARAWRGNLLTPSS